MLRAYEADVRDVFGSIINLMGLNMRVDSPVEKQWDERFRFVLLNETP